MSRIWVKICGTTNLRDALLAIDAGADAVGFVFAPSKRQVSPEAVAEMTKELPPSVARIGVFLNESADSICKTVEQAGLSGVQLHGDEHPELVAAVAERFRKNTSSWVIKGLHFGEHFGTELKKWSENPSINALLIDSGNPQHGGGTGQTFDWNLARRARQQLAPDIKVIVAGGLNPENVVAAINVLNPWGVDVVSGVEVTPGIKDPERLRAFIRAARGEK